MSTQIFVVLIVLTTTFCRLDMCLAAKSEPCEYDLDLTKNTVKITCQGSPSVVNVYAEKAMLQADEHIRGNPGEKWFEQQMANGGAKNQNMETAGTGYHPEIHTSSRPETHSPGEPFQKDWQEMRSKYAGSFDDVVRNATMKLDMAKQSLSDYTNSIENINLTLAAGDLLLRADMEKLRKTSNSATDLKDGIIIALTNQYNFMKTDLLAKNNELDKLVVSLRLLVDVTYDGLHSALKAHRMAMDEVLQVNRSLQALSKRVSRDLKKRDQVNEVKGNKNEQCPKEISAIGSGSYISVAWQTGSYMVQSVHPSEFRSVFIMKGTGPAYQLLEYHSPVDVEPDLVGKYFDLPFSCSGTGHVVYRRHFYCHKHDTNIIVKYHLKRMDPVQELPLPGAQFGNKTPYSSGSNTDIDLAVDEEGLWAIYTTKDSAGKMVISKIDHKILQIKKNWTTSYPKKQIGNAFMICGVLYAVNSHKDTPTFIRYMYNTETEKEHIFEKGELLFPNSALLSWSDDQQKSTSEKSANTVMLSYDYRTSALYSWNSGRIEIFPVYFKEK